MKSLIEARIEKSDEKLDSMTVLMLHYCAGLQHCLDQEEVERVKLLEEEKSSRDRDTTSEGIPEDISTVLDETDIADDGTANVEGTSTQDGDFDLSAAALADGSGKEEMEEELLMADAVEAEASSEVEDEVAEDATLVSNDEVVLSDVQPAISCETEDDLSTETCAETELAAANMVNAVMPETGQNVDAEEELTELSGPPALSVETSIVGTTSHSFAHADGDTH